MGVCQMVKRRMNHRIQIADRIQSLMNRCHLSGIEFWMVIQLSSFDNLKVSCKQSHDINIQFYLETDMNSLFKYLHIYTTAICRNR